MPQRIMVLVDDRRHRSTRRMEEPLQQRQTPYLTRQLDAERVRKTNSNSSRNCLEPGPQNGAAPSSHTSRGPVQRAQLTCAESGNNIFAGLLQAMLLAVPDSIGGGFL